MAAMRLQASDGKALLIVGASCYNGRWYCNVFLEAENEIIKLGEGGFEQIRSQMLSSLHPPYETKKGVFCGKEVDFFWIFNLMGPHAAIYGVPINKNNEGNEPNITREISLYWQTADGTRHYMVKLSEEYIQSWLKILKNTEQLPEARVDTVSTEKNRELPT